MPSKVDEVQAAEYVRRIAAGTWPHALKLPTVPGATGPYFQGTVSGWALNGSQFLVDVDRADGGTQAGVVCALPGYYPRAGDVVECAWRDAAAAFVAYPLLFASGAANPYTARVYDATGAPVLASPAATQYTAFDRVEWDFAGSWDAANQRYVVPLPGMYRVAAGLSASFTGATWRLFAAVYQNGSEARRGVDLAVPSGAAAASLVSDRVRCAAGDLLDVRYVASSAATGNTGPALIYFTVTYEGFA